jgi:hypothetical protein
MRFGANDQVQLEKVCVDTKLKWSRVGNVWHNASARSLLYAWATRAPGARGAGSTLQREASEDLGRGRLRSNTVLSNATWCHHLLLFPPSSVVALSKYVKLAAAHEPRRDGDSTTRNPPSDAASPIYGLDNVEHLAMHLDVLGCDGHVLVFTVTDFDLIVEATGEPGEIYEVRSSVKNLVATSGGRGFE